MKDRRRRVRVFSDGRNQVIHIPHEFKLPGAEVTIRREGNRLVIAPADRPSLLKVVSSWQPLVLDFPDGSDPAPEPVDL